MSARKGVKLGERDWHLMPEAIELLRRATKLYGWARVASESDVDERTLRRALDGCACSRLTHQRAQRSALRYAQQWLKDCPLFRIAGDA